MIELYKGDALERIKRLEDKSIDLIVTDPPYLLKSINGGGSVNRVKHMRESLEQIEAANMILGYDIGAYAEEFMRIMKTPNIYFWANKAQIPEYFDVYVHEYKCKFDIICWHKTNALPTYSNKYLSDTEYCLYFHKGGVVKPESYEDAKSWFVAPLNQKDKKAFGHPTIKYLHMIEPMIRNSSRAGDLVFDPFMGSGTTGVAARKLGRNFIGCELNEEYFKTAKTRIDNEVQ